MNNKQNYRIRAYLTCKCPWYILSQSRISSGVDILDFFPGLCDIARQRGYTANVHIVVDCVQRVLQTRASMFRSFSGWLRPSGAVLALSAELTRF